MFIFVQKPCVFVHLFLSPSLTQVLAASKAPMRRMISSLIAVPTAVLALLNPRHPYSVLVSPVGHSQISVDGLYAAL